MATNVSRDLGKDYRGIGMPDPRFKAANLARADSAFTEANPRPGVPVASQNTGLVLETSGNMPNIATMSPAGTLPAIVLTTNKGGMPGVADARHTFAPNYGTPAGGSYETVVGWETGSAISRIEKVLTSANNISMEGCITLQSNVMMVGTHNSTTLAYTLHRKTFDAAGYAATGAVRWNWSSATFATGTNIKRVLIPGTLCFIQLPEGRVHAYYMVHDNTVSSGVGVGEVGEVMMRWSDDDGVTWRANDKYLLDVSIDTSSTFNDTAAEPGFDIDRMRVAYSNGQVLLLIAGRLHDGLNYYWTNALWQYASSDLGESFTQVNLGGTNGALYIASAGAPAASATTQHAGTFIDLTVAKDGVFVASYSCVRTAAGGNYGAPCTKRLGTAYTPWTDVTAVVISDNTYGVRAGQQYISQTNTTIACDEPGKLSVAWQNDTFSIVNVSLIATSNAVISVNDGVSWIKYQGSLDYTYSGSSATRNASLWRSGDTAFYPTGYCSLYQCGRWIWFTQFMTWNGEGQHTATLSAINFWELDLGGYTTATRSFKNDVERERAQLTWDYNWAALVRMTDVTGWTATGTGTEVLNTGGYSEVTTTAGQTKDIANLGLTIDASPRLIGQVEFKCTSGASSWEILLDNGVNFNMNLALRQSTTQCKVVDLNGAELASIASPSLAGFNTFLYCVDWATSRAQVWVRASDNDLEIRQWVLLLDYVAVAKPGATIVAAPGRLRASQNQNSVSQWRNNAWGSGISGRQMFRGAAASAAGFEDTIYGRAYSPYPVHVYSGDGVKVRAVDGPSWDGDVFTVTQRHDYGVENVFTEVSPSPRRTWRSTSLAQQDVVVTLDNSNDPGPLLGSTLVIGAFNCNFQQLQVSYRTVAAGAWTALGTLLFNQGQTALKWIRDGHMVRPATAAGATSATDYFTYNILEDSHIQIEDNNGTVVRAITRNSEGTWFEGTKLRPHIYCAGIAATDLASGVAGEIWSKDGVILIHDMPDAYQLKFTIPAGLTAEGYFEIGSLIVGHVAYFGRQYARGRNLQWAPNYNLTTGRGGTRRAQSLGPSRRSVEFSWANEGETDTTTLATNPPNPDYITSGGASPVANPADTAYKMAGLVEHLRGAVTPCVYLSKIPVVAAETTDSILINRNLFMLGRIVSEPRIETVLGDEWGAAAELVRIATVTLEEEV